MEPFRSRRFAVAALLLLVLACRGGAQVPAPEATPIPERPGEPDGFVEALTAAAMERLEHPVRYDGSYRSIAYPGGDVPDHIGVCTDVVIRSYRVLGIDLQQLVHEDMSAAFASYPDRWGLSRPDPNIDHRRVPNLETFFSRHGEVLPVTDGGADYLPGDLVTWNLGPLPHIGIVSAVPSANGERFRIVHNIGRGPELEDMIFDYPIVGHFRYYGPSGSS